MGSMFNITDKGINLLINSIEQQKNKYFWVRSPDFQEQLYISEGFQSVWGQDNAKLFEHPMSFVDALIKDDSRPILDLFEKRARGQKEDREQTVLARLKSTGDQSIVHWRDSCFCVCDTYGNIVGVAGIGEVISESEWYYDLEGKVKEPTPLALLKKSSHAQYLVNEMPDSISFQHVEIPCRRVKSRYYALTWPVGEVALTRRELQCVYCLFAGMTSKQTARELKISPKVVEEYLNNIRLKLECSNKMELFKRIKHVVR
jgi:DNA-binding CsgD family transcriptional regulator